MGGVEGKPLPTDVARDNAQHPSTEKSVGVEGDEERVPNAGDPERNAHKTGAPPPSSPPSNRPWPGRSFRG
eukprot:scaffold1137_cov392-Pavlova_lutheri.AAC.1